MHMLLIVWPPNEERQRNKRRTCSVVGRVQVRCSGYVKILEMYLPTTTVAWLMPAGCGQGPFRSRAFHPSCSCRDRPFLP
jgi:hypothetical protein